MDSANLLIEDTMGVSKGLVLLLLATASNFARTEQTDVDNLNVNGSQTNWSKVEQRCIVTGNKFKLSITGNVVKLSDIVFSTCRQFPQVIELFALEKAIIDEDLILIGKEVQLVIIAPKWEVVPNETANPGRRLINLSGSNGANFTELEAKNGIKDGNRNGAHGLAGRPGGPSGSFYGIADEIINAEQLTILADGGRGGNGQNGGNGAEGADGISYTASPTFKCGDEPPGFKYSYRRKSVFTGFGNKQEYTYIIIGKSGKLGGRGGNGGIGGMMGQKGSVVIEELSKSERNRFQSSAANGQAGSDGAGGNPGLGGKNGNKVMVPCTILINPTEIKLPASNIMATDSNTGRAKSGLMGQSGVSLKNRTISLTAQIAQSFASTVNRYKMYIRPYLADSNFTSEMLSYFYDALNTREKIVNTYDTLSLVEDFIGLEKHFFALNGRMNFTLSYVYLKKRIDTYAENPNDDEDTAEYRNTLADLKTDIEERVESVKSMLWYYDVKTDIQKQANLYLLRSVRQLKNFGIINSKLELLKDNIQLLDETIKNGEDLISNVAETAIANSEDALDQELDSLLKEIVQMEEKVMDNQNELVKNRLQLQNTMRLKGLFGVLKTGFGVLGIINPALGFVGAVASSSITVIEAKTTDDTEAQVAVIPKALENLATGTEKYFKILKEKQDKVIKEQEKYVNKTRQTTTAYGIAIIDEMWNSAMNYRSDNTEALVQNRGQGIMRFYARKVTELTTSLEKLKASNDTNPEKINAINTGLDLAKYLKTTSEAFKTGSESVLSIMKDRKKVNEIDAALEKNRNDLERLYSVENNIYTTVEPMLDDMKSNLNNVQQDLKNMNKFQQTIAKWNVTRVIEDVKRILSNATKTFQVNEEINWTLSELLKTFDLLFDMHQLLLEETVKQQDKIDETNLHIAHASNLLISDSELRYALSELQVVSSSNDVAKKYHEWISAVKQFAFPYFGKNMDKLKELDSFREKDLTTFNNFIVRNIEDIIEYSDSSVLIDPKHKTHFRGSNVADERENFSFYSWKNGDNKQTIKDILNGNETTLLADIRKSSLPGSAVKFNRVKLLFTSTDSMMQEKLSKELNNFDVQLTHHGDSKYKFGDSIYEIRNTPTILKFNYDLNYFARDTNIVTRLAVGPYMLSPYATWSIQLLPIQPSRNFESLQEFVELVDLELIGNGEYFHDSTCNSTCENAMKKYYTLATDQ